MQIPRLEELVRAYNTRQAELDKYGIYFLRDITDEDAERFSKAIYIMGADLRGFPDSRITIHINSGGGSVGAGFAMMEMIYKVKRDFRVPINTVITGYAYSMGAIVFQAGDKRSMGHFSTMMLHSTSWMLSGEDQRVFKDYERLAALYQSNIAELFAKRTGKHTAAWWKRFIYSGRDRFLSANECLALGLVDEICEFDACYNTLEQPSK